MYFNNKLDNSSYIQKYTGIPQFARLNFFQSKSYWSHNVDFYDNAIDALEQNNALVLNITGDVKRQPGTYTMISLDRSIANVQTDSKKELEKEKMKFKNYEGLWFNGKVQNIICPAKPQYRQKIVLFRNFIPRLGKAALTS